ncbi:MAG: 30S ribosome-binding factor RbfA [Bacilli bacterium]
MGYRIDRVEKMIERELAVILMEEAKNELLKFVSITKVTVTKDLSLATIWYTVLGNEGEIEATSKQLVNATGFLKTELAHRLDLRKTPDLRFKYDESLAYGNKISQILENLKK